MTEEIDYDLYAMQCDTISNCKCLNRIILILEFYQQNMKQIEQNSDILLKYMEKYTNLLNDYAHIINFHLNQHPTINDANFLIVNNLITRYVKCESITKCQQFKRSRCKDDNNISPKLLRNDKTVQFYLDMFDTIHCFLMHSYDAGYRIKPQAFGSSTKSARQPQFDGSMLSRSKISISRSKKMSMSRSFNNRNTYSSMQRVTSSTLRKSSSRLLKSLNRQSLYQRKTTDKDVLSLQKSIDDGSIKFYDDREMTELRSFSKSKRRDIETNARQRSKFSADILIKEQQKLKDTDKWEYNFGQKCYYWPFFKENNSKDKIYNPLCRYKAWYIEQKWSNLEEEILNNATYTLDKDTYDKAVKKAEMFLKKSEIKRLTSRNADSFWVDKGKADEFHYEIKEDTPIDKQHLLSIILYTDTTTLSYHFSKSFRKLSINEPNFRFRARKSEYWNWSKIITETVNLYGTDMQHRKSDIFYTGISTKVVFNELIAFFNCPTSTTTEKSIAITFANENGCILEVTQNIGAGESLRFFNCSFVSKFSEESERLFVV